MAEHAILAFAKYRRFLVTHPDGTHELVDWDGDTGAGIVGKEHYAGRVWTLKYLDLEPINERGFRERPKAKVDRWCHEATVTPKRGWEAAWCDVSGQHRLDVTIDSWYWGVPAQAIVQMLDEYAKQGWAVAHVSEDRGVYFGTDVTDESYITRLRYLLVRDSSKPQQPS